MSASVNGGMLRPRPAFARPAPRLLPSSRGADSHKPRPLEERVEPTHLGERFDPRPGTTAATRTNERRRNAGPAIGWMQHHARQRCQLAIERLQLHSRPPSRESEEPRALRQRDRRRCEYADADRLVAVPQQRDAADEAEVMAPVMPPSEVRPVGTGAGGEPQLAGEADVFFFTWVAAPAATSGTSEQELRPTVPTSMRPSSRHCTCTSGCKSSTMSSCVVATRQPMPVRVASFRRLNAITLASVRSSAAVNSSATIHRGLHRNRLSRADSGTAGRRSTRAACAAAVVLRRVRTQASSASASCAGRPSPSTRICSPSSSRSHQTTASETSEVSEDFGCLDKRVRNRSAAARIRLDLPEPDGPVKQTMSPGSIGSSRPSAITCRPVSNPMPKWSITTAAFAVSRFGEEVVSDSEAHFQ